MNKKLIVLICAAFAPFALVGSVCVENFFKAVGSGDVAAVRAALPYVNVKEARAALGWSALHLAPNEEMAHLLINAGAPLNVVNEAGDAPLHFPTNNRVAGVLIARGADVNIKSRFGTTPLDNALAHFKNFKTPESVARITLIRLAGGITSRELKTLKK